MRFRPQRLSILIGLLAVSCASELHQRPAAEEPSSPKAQEAVVARIEPPGETDPLTLYAPGPDSGTLPPKQHRHQHGSSAPPGDSSTIYVCPMHPEVRSSEPGRCSKCGMRRMPSQHHHEAKP